MYTHNSMTLSYTVRRSNFEVQLVPSDASLTFLGRVEVRYNGTWVPVCDNSFRSSEADVICNMLNFTRGAACYVPRSRFGRGTGK